MPVATHSQNAFEELLAWLEPDAELAAERYMEIHQRLITMFSHRGCADPEELADETLTRVALKPPAGELRQVDPARYIFRVAHFVCLEHLHHARKERAYAQSVDIAYNEAAESEEMTLLEECMQRLKPEERQLLLAYYGGNEWELIKPLKASAKMLAHANAALQIKAYKLKQQLKMWIEEARARQAKRGGGKK